MSEKITQIVEDLKTLSLLEASELVLQIEEVLALMHRLLLQVL